jgi:hypothetical protein
LSSIRALRDRLESRLKFRGGEVLRDPAGRKNGDLHSRLLFESQPQFRAVFAPPKSSSSLPQNVSSELGAGSQPMKCNVAYGSARASATPRLFPSGKTCRLNSLREVGTVVRSSWWAAGAQLVGSPRPSVAYDRVGRSFIFPVLSMDAHTYPGRGLSIQQLVFALNEELKRVAHPPSYVATNHPRLTKEQVFKGFPTDSLRTRSLNLNGTLRPHWQLFASGRTPSFQSTASHSTSSLSSPSTSLKRIVSTPRPSVVIGVEPSLITARYGLNYSSRKARTT